MVWLSLLLGIILLLVLSLGVRVSQSSALAMEPYILCSKQPYRFILRVILGIVLIYDRIGWASNTSNIRVNIEKNIFKELSPSFIPRMWVYWMLLNPSQVLQKKNIEADPGYCKSIKRVAAIILALRNIAASGGVSNSGNYCFFGSLRGDGTVKPTIDSSYCTVGYGGAFFELELAQVDSILEIENALNSLLAVQTEKSGQYYSLATCGNVEGYCQICWSLSKNKDNADAMARLEGAAFHVSLESDVIANSSEDRAWELRAWPRSSRNYANQIQLVVFQNGEVAIMFSHIDTHGVPAARLAGEVFRQSEAELSNQCSAVNKDRLMLVARPLSWNVNEVVRDAAVAVAESTSNCVPSGKERAQLVWSCPLGMHSGARFGVNVHALLCIALQMAAYQVDKRPWPLWVTAVDENEEPVKAQPMITLEVIELLVALRKYSVYDAQALGQKLGLALDAHSRRIDPDSSLHFNNVIKNSRALSAVLNIFFIFNPRYKHTFYVADLGCIRGVTAFGGAGRRTSPAGAVIKISRSDPRGAWVDVLLENGPLADRAEDFVLALKDSIQVLNGILTLAHVSEHPIESNSLSAAARETNADGAVQPVLRFNSNSTVRNTEKTKELLSFLSTTIGLDAGEDQELDEETPLAGLVDSLAVARIAHFIFDRWGLRFRYRDFAPEHLHSVATLINHINKADRTNHREDPSRTEGCSDIGEEIVGGPDLKDIKATGFLERFAEIATTYPHSLFATYVSCDGNHRRVDYGELYAHSARRALALREHGITRNEVVAIVMLDDYEVALTFLASMRIGALPTVLAPPSPKVTPEHYALSLRGLVERCRPVCVVTTQDMGQEPGLLECFSPEQILTFSDFVGDDESIHDICFIPDPNDIAFLQHSSGTTGLQKGVSVTYRMLEQQMQMLLTALQYSNNDKIISWLPLYHDMGLIACMLFPVYSGGRLVQIPTFDWLADPLTLFEQITINRATLCWLPNFAFLHLAQCANAGSGNWDLTSMRAFISCSEPVQRNAFTKFQEAAKPYGLRSGCLAASYAMAENVFAVTQTELNKDAPSCWVDIQSLAKGKVIGAAPNTVGAREMVSSGRLISGNQIRIVDSDGHMVDGYTVGEIELSGPCTAFGYYRNPEDSKLVFKYSWYSTGDLGFIHKGEVYITGRKKDLLIIRGENIHPQDIENAATESGAIHPGRVAAVGIANEVSGTEEVVLFVERRRESKILDNEIISRVRSSVKNIVGLSVARVLVLPHGWLIKSTSGKISRAKSLVKARAEELVLD